MRRLAPLLLVAAVAAVALIWAWRPSSDSARADTTGPRMALRAAGDSVSCDVAADPTACTAPPGASLELTVEVVEGPPMGYVAFQTEVFYGDLVYMPASVVDEVLWPDGLHPESAARSPGTPSGEEGVVAHADTSVLQPPFDEDPSTYTGPVVTIELACPAEGGDMDVALLPYVGGDPERALGSGFAEPLSADQTQTVPAKTSGERMLDLDGDTTAETVDVADALTVDCSGATPTSTATPTPTPTPTATPDTPTGDVNCNGTVNSIDAALILQFVASLIDSLPCEAAADADGDGFVDAVDAVLILQFDAGLLEQLPS